MEATIDAGLLTVMTPLFVWRLFMRPLRFALQSGTAQAKAVMDKRAEQALRNSARNLRLFADNIPAMTASWDENQRCRFANKMYSEFYGFTVEDILGKHVREVVGEEAYREIERNNVMALTRDFKETVVARIKRDPEFARALLNEAATLFLNGEPDMSKLILRDLVNATIGFEQLAQSVEKPSKSVHRMLSPAGNPTMTNLAAIFAVLKNTMKVQIETHAVNVA